MEVSLQLPYDHLPYSILSIKITATQTFGLCNCSEDDTIFLLKEHLFGDSYHRLSTPILGRFFLLKMSNGYSLLSSSSIQIVLLEGCDKSISAD